MNGIWMGKISPKGDGKSVCEMTYWDLDDATAPGTCVDITGAHSGAVMHAAVRALNRAVQAKQKVQAEEVPA